MDTLTNYHNFFENLATRHKSILHTDEEKHFARINLSKHPVLGAEELREFIQGQARTLHAPFIISSAPTYENTGDNDSPQKKVMGEFFVFNVAKGKYNEQEATQTAMEQIGYDCCAEIKKYYDNNEDKGFFALNTVGIEFINRVFTKDYLGVKIYFEISLSSYDDFHNRESSFNEQ